MNIKRFTAPTSREALAKARMAFGDGTLILSNRPTANGVEVVATAEDTLSALDGAAAQSGNPPLLAPKPARTAPQRASQPAVSSRARTTHKRGRRQPTTAIRAARHERVRRTQ